VHLLEAGECFAQIIAGKCGNAALFVGTAHSLAPSLILLTHRGHRLKLRLCECMCACVLRRASSSVWAASPEIRHGRRRRVHFLAPEKCTCCSSHRRDRSLAQLARINLANTQQQARGSSYLMQIYWAAVCELPTHTCNYYAKWIAAVIALWTFSDFSSLRERWKPFIPVEKKITEKGNLVFTSFQNVYISFLT
jgi:hypothetical protein